MKRDLEFAVGRPPVSAWWQAAPVQGVALAIAGILLAFWSTTQSIVATWIRSETFVHGFVVVPLCIWLAWRRRADLAAVDARPWWWGLAFVVGAGALWLVAATANVHALTQFALAFMLQAAIVTIVGLRVGLILAFPLAFLLFAVPTGEFLLPTLMDWTADFTIAALRLSGVPVYREANSFIIPTGAWSVVEACSGVRYLIASVMVGTIYAAVAYRSARRRALFIAAAIVVPILANWIRAYMIVMLGHLSNNRLAVGVDHLIYGWLFFGVVMLLLFWIGSFWQEPGAESTVSAVTSTLRAPTAASWRPLFSAAVASIIAAIVWLPVDAVVQRGVSTAALALAPIEPVRGWATAKMPILDWKPRYAGYATDLQQTFESEGRRVGLYIAYYRSQSKGHELVTSSNSLARRADGDWNQLGSRLEPVPWNGREVDGERIALAGRLGKLEIYRLYWIAGQITSNDYVAKAWLALSKLTGRGDDSALVVIYTPADDHAAETAHKFASDMSPAIERALATARAAGH
jgi:exosortase A